MWFVSKKKYNELLKQKKDFERIALDALAQNGRLLSQVDDTIKEMEGIQELNHRLVARNEDMLAQIGELEAKLSFAIKQRDYYYGLLENTSEMEERNE